MIKICVVKGDMKDFNYSGDVSKGDRDVEVL